MSKDRQRPPEVGKRVCLWTVQEVYDWVRVCYPSRQAAFLLAIVNHSISGRALLRLTDSKLERMGVGQEQHKEILHDVMILRVHEELENLNDIVSVCSS
ncbi:sterile alpha motif domain-containing protein 12 isoform X2 [Amia ocellicauda]|uniref:sterile alpha motif domain-containing protein 12 isoform X2 n=1 Tax=Amia ocellicauda TaxID=2972642 RepID=UPI00346473D4